MVVDRKMLIPIVSKLQDVLSSLHFPINFDLPQIAVVGSQSCGKSSVLENFVGFDFLPRGSGIVTRRPLVLHLAHSHDEYAEFFHNRNQKYTDFDQVRKEIEVETEKISGKNKGISVVPIHLKIYSPKVLNLILIDLPGMTKVAVGDQPVNIESEIRNMIMEYIKKDSCLILAVHPANSDLANSDALKLAKEVDPQGRRTIGVVTKLDLMDEGTDAREILENRLMPLRLGYFGVVNRSQKDINEKKDAQSAMTDERSFFLTHKAYRSMADRMGTDNLLKVLNQQLSNHIKQYLPKLKHEIQSKLSSIESEVESFRNIRLDDVSYKIKTLTIKVKCLENEFLKSIHGCDINVELVKLSYGAVISNILHEKFPNSLKKIKTDNGHLRRKVSIAIQNTTGIRTCIFFPVVAFETVVKAEINKYREPAIKCVEMVLDELSKQILLCANQIDKFPVLRLEFLRMTNKRIAEEGERAVERVNELLDMQMEYINVNEDDFQAIICNNKRNAAIAGISELDRVVKNGWLQIDTFSILKPYKNCFFILTKKSLSCYNDEKTNEMKFDLPLNELMIQCIDKTSFQLSYVDQRSVYRNKNILRVLAENRDTLSSWILCLHQVGVHSKTNDVEEVVMKDYPTTNNANYQVQSRTDTILQLVEAYLKTVRNSLKDLVPRTIVYFIICNIKQFFKDNILSLLFNENLDELMEMSSEAKQRMKFICTFYDALKRTKDVIDESCLELT